MPSLTQSNSIQMKLTVRELVAFGRFPYSGNRVTLEDQKIIDRAISYMELEGFQDRFIDELSGGQRQRAMIAMVIAQDTEYVLLDEPTNNLDIYHATNMMKIVRRLCDELGKTVIRCCMRSTMRHFIPIISVPSRTEKSPDSALWRR